MKATQRLLLNSIHQTIIICIQTNCQISTLSIRLLLYVYRPTVRSQLYPLDYYYMYIDQLSDLNSIHQTFIICIQTNCQISTLFIRLLLYVCIQTNCQISTLSIRLLLNVYRATVRSQLYPLDYYYMHITNCQISTLSIRLLLLYVYRPTVRSQLYPLDYYCMYIDQL